MEKTITPSSASNKSSDHDSLAASNHDEENPPLSQAELEQEQGHELEQEHEQAQGHDKEQDESNSDKAQIQVKFEDNDPKDPLNWSAAYRSWITFQLGMLALSASLASSILAPAQEVIAEYTGVSEEASVLCVSLYILGFAFGPMLWAPISEIWGRRPGLLPAMVGLALFTIGSGVSQNAQSIFVTRFFAGLFGSAPVSNVAGALGDIWKPKQRGTAVALYALAVVGGPTIGPVVGSALVANPHLGWRWTCYISAIWAFTFFVLSFFCLPETYAPYLLKKKAIRLRKETGDSRYHHPHEDVKIDPKSIVTKHFTRPMIMLVTEPMVTCIAIYASFVYALLYMTLQVFPIVFEQNRHWPTVSSTLPFLALFVGVLCAVAINIGNQPRYARAVTANKGKPVPEARLPPMLIGGFLFVIGLFWFGWTADPSIPWPSCVIAAAFIGAGFNVIFQQCINFLVDTYLLYAASAVSANTLLRSLLAAGLPLAARPMFLNLGVGPAMSILGGIATLALPVPLLFMHYGLRLRKMSKFAPVHD